MTRVVAVLVVVLLAGCTTAPDAGTPAPLPAAGAGFDYQLGGGYPSPAGVTVIARDSTTTPSRARTTSAT